MRTTAWPCNNDSGDAPEDLAPPVIQDVDVTLVVEIEFREIIGRFIGPVVRFLETRAVDWPLRKYSSIISA